VRPATVEDAAAIAAIYNQTALNGQTSPTNIELSEVGIRQMVGDLQGTGWPFYVFTTHDEVAGYVFLKHFSWEPQACMATAELNVYISAPWRNVGLGIHMAGFIYTLADSAGCSNVACWIMDINSASHRLARATGCVEWAKFPKLTRSAGALVDVSVVGNSVDAFFATNWGRRIRQRQAAAWRTFEQRAATALTDNPNAVTEIEL